MSYPNGGWNIQTAINQADTAGITGRRLTTGLVAPGRQYTFTNSKPTPDGQWALVQSEWIEGQRTDLFWVKLTPWNPAGSASGNDFTRLTRQVRSPARVSQVRARFGYMENEPAGSTNLHFYGTSRAEATTTGTNKNNDPFSFLSDSAPAALPCAHGCSLTIPVIPGRVVYYVLDWLDEKGNVIQSSAPDVAAAASRGKAAGAR